MLYIVGYLQEATVGNGDRPNDGGSKDLWNVGKLLPDYTVVQPRRRRFRLYALKMKAVTPSFKLLKRYLVPEKYTGSIFGFSALRLNIKPNKFMDSVVLCDCSCILGFALVAHYLIRKPDTLFCGS
jgi:hypothetical protein